MKSLRITCSLTSSLCSEVTLLLTFYSSSCFSFIIIEHIVVCSSGLYLPAISLPGLPPLLLFSHSVVSDCLWPHGLQHIRFPCLSLPPRVCSNSCPSCWWSLPTISSSVVPFSSCLKSFPASGSFPVSLVAKVLEFQLQHHSFQWIFRIDFLGLTGLISLQSKGLSRVFSNTTVQKHQFFGTQPFFMVQLSHPYMTTGKTISLTRWTFVSKVMSLLFNVLLRSASKRVKLLGFVCWHVPSDLTEWVLDRYVLHK